jgi:hypothetical protein
MREIKFRAWSSKGLRFWYFDYTVGFNPENNDCFSYPMQYTGLKDKNGKEIYEGDVLNCQDRIVKVIWHEQAGQWDTVFIKYVFDLCSNGITNQEWKYRAVVIGNIYENPELLDNAL